jgi:lauroyl/myristoyl acyltransferase
MEDTHAPATTLDGPPPRSSGQPLLVRSVILVRRVIGRTMWILWPRVPYRVARPLIQRKVRRALADPARLGDAREQMEHLLGAIDRSSEVDAASRAYVEHWVRCDWLHWNPRTITRQRVEGGEHLIAAHGIGKGVLLSFVHHAHFAGFFASVARIGVPVHVVAAPLASPGPNFIQHLHVVGKGGGLVSAGRGTAGIVEELGRGRVVASAIDVPGGSRASFAGRQVRCSSGAAHAAIAAGAPIVVLTSHHDEDGPYIRLSEPLDPEQFDGAQELLAELVARHEEAVLAWPEVAYLPTTCWSPI